MTHTELISYCGLYCGACSFRVACQDSERKHLAAMPAKYDKFKNEPLGEPCGGCKPDPNSCGDCGIRTCAKGKGLSHCGLCADFPCARITEFSRDGVPHHAEVMDNLKAIREMGEEAWVAAQEKSWTCACGTKLSWYLRKCPKCGSGG